MAPSAGVHDPQRHAWLSTQRMLSGWGSRYRSVDNQAWRWGSCTPSDGAVRISSRLAREPGWVLDYVIVHELAHLLVASHGQAFWALVNRYPRTERARGFLMARGLEPSA